ncbi:hypothetical protein AAH978_12425 [Streptomyces sp. ZYX-F-203]
MTRHDREAAVRELLGRAMPAVPADLYAEAVRRGERLRRRRAIVRRLLLPALGVATVALAVWLRGGAL